jgi:hypothetical protein
LEVVKKKEINFDNAVSNTIENDRNVDKFNKPAAHDTIQKSGTNVSNFISEFVL